MTKKKNKTTREQVDPEFQNLIRELETAVASGAWMVCLFSMNGNQVRLFRKTGGEPGFPVDDFETAVNLLDDDLRREREKVEGQHTPAPMLGKKL